MRFAPLVALFAGSFLISASAAAHRQEPKTEAGVLAASDDWIAAERLGHVADVDARLVDSYQDVESNGHAHSKAELLHHTATRKDIWKGTPSEVAQAFHKAYPSTKKVTVVGDTAILSYYSNDAAAQPYMVAEDTFTYLNGMWKGVLSSHFHMVVATKP